MNSFLSHTIGLPLLCGVQRQQKIQRERLMNDFSAALNNFQAVQRRAAEKEKESVARARAGSRLSVSRSQWLFHTTGWQIKNSPNHIIWESSDETSDLRESCFDNLCFADLTLTVVGFSFFFRLKTILGMKSLFLLISKWLSFIQGFLLGNMELLGDQKCSRLNKSGYYEINNHMSNYRQNETINSL